MEDRLTWWRYAGLTMVLAGLAGAVYLLTRQAGLAAICALIAAGFTVLSDPFAAVNLRKKEKEGPELSLKQEAPAAQPEDQPRAEAPLPVNDRPQVEVKPLVVKPLVVAGSEEPPPSQAETQAEAPPLAKDEQEDASRQWWRSMALVSLMAIIAFGIVHAASAGCGRGGEERAAAGEAKDLTVRLGPELERAIALAIQHGPTPTGGLFGSGSAEGAGGGATWVTVLLAAIAAALLAWTVKKRPSAAPIVGAAELALAAIKNADKLSSLDSRMFWFATIAFLGTAAIFLFTALWRMRGEPVVPQITSAEGEGRSDRDKDGSRKKLDSPLSIGFSALILAWAVVMVAYHRPAAQEPPPPPKTTASARVISLKRLSPAPLFARGRSEVTPTSVDAIGRAFEAAHGDGDRLLLLGSADCMEIHKSARDNMDLAQARAARVRQQLVQQHAVPEDAIEIEVLPQYKRCTESEDLRAVFPFVAHAETVER